jgi:hypothetical protein
MIAKRPIVAFAVASLLAGASSVASAQHAGHGMPMGGEIVIPKARPTRSATSSSCRG